MLMLFPEAILNALSGNEFSREVFFEGVGGESRGKLVLTADRTHEQKELDIPIEDFAPLNDELVRLRLTARGLTLELERRGVPTRTRAERTRDLVERLSHEDRLEMLNKIKERYGFVFDTEEKNG